MKQSVSSVLETVGRFFQNSQIKAYLSYFALIIGIVIGYLLPSVGAQEYSLQEIRADESSFRYINPLLECDVASFDDAGSLSSLKRTVEDLTEEEQRKGTIEFASVYYRDLNNGPWFGIEQEEKFSPASLIKVPLMMAYYKQSEKDPAVLEQQLPIQTVSAYEDQNIKPATLLEQGKSYSVRELINRMVVHSDNVAFNELLNHLGLEKYESTYDDLGIEIHNALINDPNGDILSVKDYATFFRVLYNSSYLEPASSEALLEMMTKSEFKGGLVNGVDPGVTVAHKYGERYYTVTGVRQFHDCGIVYVPQKPYLLCIMTSGNDLNALADYVKEVSALVYEKNTKGS